MKAFLECNIKEYLDDFVYTSILPLYNMGVDIIKFDGTSKWYDDIKIRSIDNKFHSIEDNDIIIGSVEATGQFFRLKGLKEPNYIGYPDTLKPFLKRDIISLKLHECLNYQFPFFIKPSNKIKLFTGTTVENNKQFDILTKYMNVPLCTDVFMSEILNFESEYRCFIHKSKLVGIKHYKGDYTLFPDINIINQMINVCNDLPISYTLDVGIVNKETILIEVNDFWAIGGYGLDGDVYVRMLIDRFKQIKNEQYI